MRSYRGRSTRHFRLEGSLRFFRVDETISRGRGRISGQTGWSMKYSVGMGKEKGDESFDEDKGSWMLTWERSLDGNRGEREEN